VGFFVSRHLGLLLCNIAIMKRFIPLFILTGLFIGCSHTLSFSNYDLINSLTKGKVATLKLLEGDNIKGIDIQITTDSTYWIEPIIGIKNAVPTSQVHMLVIVKRRRGAWEGFRPFFGAGLALGLWGLIEGDDPPCASGPNSIFCFRFSATDKFFIGNTFGIVSGVIPGLIGYIVGSRDVYVINPTPSNP